jgi:DNA-binding XRE family transcriptional regulator
MGRTRREIVDGLDAADRAEVEAQTSKLRAEVEGLRALRLIAKRSQEQIAEGLGVSQPAVLKMERQTDLYLSTLHSSRPLAASSAMRASRGKASNSGSNAS